MLSIEHAMDSLKKREWLTKTSRKKPRPGKRPLARLRRPGPLEQRLPRRAA